MIKKEPPFTLEDDDAIMEAYFEHKAIVKLVFANLMFWHQIRENSTILEANVLLEQKELELIHNRLDCLEQKFAQKFDY